MIFEKLKNIGPGALVAAAFIGPGTVTTCTLAGVNFGYALLWAVLISIIATIALQEMSARAGLISGKGLAGLIKSSFPNPVIRKIVLGLIFSAIVVGNAAYEAGNLSGGVLGIQALFPDGSVNSNVIVILLGILACIILFIGDYKVIEKSLVTLVIIMSITFIITAILTKPDVIEIFKGLFTFQSPEGSLLLVLGLVGTTVVPYNLFLHASLVQRKWSGAKDLSAMRFDTGFSIVLGGLVSLSVVLCAIPLIGQEISNAGDLAKGLSPLLGSFSKYFLGIGLFAAGLTSAITAPLAASFVAAGCFDWEDDLKSTKFRAVWFLIIVLGVGFSLLNIKPIQIIHFAQIANGILLPVIAGILLWVMNRSNILGVHKNNRLQNLIGFSVFLFACFLGAKGLYKVFGAIF